MNRAAARRLGLKRYWTGNPCVHGGEQFCSPDFRALFTVPKATPYSSAMARLDFSGLSATALAARANAEIRPAPTQSQPAVPSAPQSEQKMRRSLMAVTPQ